MKMLLIGLLLIFQTLSTPASCEEIAPLDEAIADDSTGRSIVSAGPSGGKRYLYQDYYDRNYHQTPTYKDEEQPPYYGYRNDGNTGVHKPSYNENYEGRPTKNYSHPSDYQNSHTASERSSIDREDGEFTHVVDGTNWIQMITMGVWAYGWVILSVQFLLGLTLPPNIQNYLTIFPFKRTTGRSLKDSFLIRALESVDPVDLTFGVMNINEDQCRLRAICQLRKAVATLPLLQSMYDSYFPTSINMEKYQEAIDAGEALEDCYRLFSNCQNDPYEKLPAIF